jgi:hypothetical protein
METINKWLEDSDVLSIFPSCVWKIQLTAESRDSINSNIFRLIKQINPDFAEIPPGGSWQSMQGLHNHA